MVGGSTSSYRGTDQPMLDKLLALTPTSTLQRVALVALLAPVTLVAVCASVPALTVLPFSPDGTDRIIRLLTAYTTYASTLLTASQPSCRSDEPCTLPQTSAIEPASCSRSSSPR